MKWATFQDKHFSGFKCELLPSDDGAVISAQVYTCPTMIHNTQTGVEWRWHVWPSPNHGPWPNEAATSEEAIMAAEKEIVRVIKILVESAGLSLANPEQS